MLIHKVFTNGKFCESKFKDCCFVSAFEMFFDDSQFIFHGKSNIIFRFLGDSKINQVF